ncbi:PepSY domain-containing protein [Accumulibacter sp.]|uniref:PepSY domain-containing protein n=1 Tax=Accumulibacter sp. TaxID=2053492 RepID=UPI00261D1593|nr:PepSY domain-containing protein [Accumulibacter sp.]
MKIKTTLSATLLAILTAIGGSAVAADAKTTTPATAAAPAAAHEITKEQAIEMATKAHPGEVTKAYEDTKKGKKTWEVKINGADGKKWEVHYEIKTGALVSEEGK